MRPNVGAVVVHEDGDVAHNPDFALRAVTTQRPPLFVKSELQRTPNLDIGEQFLTRFLHSGRLPMREIMRPPVPALEFLSGSQGIEQNEVIQPPSVFRTEVFKTAQPIA